MAFNYQATAATARTLITRFGKTATFTLAGQSGSGTDPFGNPVSSTPDTNYAGVGVFLAYSTREVDGSTIERGDLRIVYSGVRPVLNATVSHDGETWRVINVDPLTPANDNVLYTIQVRK